MTRRQRLEAKLERRQAWAEGRTQKAAGLLKQNEPYRGDVAFNTQPGHIPERARAIARSEKAYEHGQMAAHHDRKADGLSRQLDRTIFSDDHNATEALRERIAEREAARDHMKAINVAIRKVRKASPDFDEAAILNALHNHGTITADEAVKLARQFSIQPYHGLGFPAWQLTNLGAEIRRDKKRIEEVDRQAQAQAQAEAAPGGIVISTSPDHDYCSVRFAEKPDRAILDALRAAGFSWGGGAWSGYTSKIPQEVRDLEAGQ